MRHRLERQLRRQVLPTRPHEKRRVQLADSQHTLWALALMQRRWARPPFLMLPLVFFQRTLGLIRQWVDFLDPWSTQWSKQRPPSMRPRLNCTPRAGFRTKDPRQSQLPLHPLWLWGTPPYPLGPPKSSRSSSSRCPSRRSPTQQRLLSVRSSRSSPRHQYHDPAARMWAFLHVQQGQKAAMR